MAIEKAPDALRTIGEVAEELDVATHVLRFWESKFTQVKPQKRRGRRYYRLEDISILKTIKELLYDKGYTISGAQKFLKDNNTQQQANNNQSTSKIENPAQGPVVAQANTAGEFKTNMFGKLTVSGNPQTIYKISDAQKLQIKDICDGLKAMRKTLAEA